MGEAWGVGGRQGREGHRVVGLRHGTLWTPCSMLGFFCGWQEGTGAYGAMKSCDPTCVLEIINSKDGLGHTYEWKERDPFILLLSRYL